MDTTGTEFPATLRAEHNSRKQPVGPDPTAVDCSR